MKHLYVYAYSFASFLHSKIALSGGYGMKIFSLLQSTGAGGFAWSTLTGLCGAGAYIGNKVFGRSTSD